MDVKNNQSRLTTGILKELKGNSNSGHSLHSSFTLPNSQQPGRVVQPTQEPEVPSLVSGRATYFRFSFGWFKKCSCQLLVKYVHEVLVNCLDSLSLPRKGVVRLTDSSNMTSVCHGHKTTIQQVIVIDLFNETVLFNHQGGRSPPRLLNRQSS